MEQRREDRVTRIIKELGGSAAGVEAVILFSNNTEKVVQRERPREREQHDSEDKVEGVLTYKRVEAAFRAKIQDNPKVDFAGMKEIVAKHIGMSVRSVERVLLKEAKQFKCKPEDLFIELRGDVEAGI